MVYIFSVLLSYSLIVVLSYFNVASDRVFLGPGAICPLYPLSYRRPVANLCLLSESLISFLRLVWNLHYTIQWWRPSQPLLFAIRRLMLHFQTKQTTYDLKRLVFPKKETIKQNKTKSPMTKLNFLIATSSSPNWCISFDAI